MKILTYPIAASRVSGSFVDAGNTQRKEEDRQANGLTYELVTDDIQVLRHTASYQV